MTDTQDQRIHDIVYSNDSRTELAERIVALEDENAKLRELVRDMWVHSYCCIAECFEDDERHIDDTINRMRELGVEVEP